MFKKILIANRGEVALRIIYACRELGIKTVVAHSQADEHSLPVRFADQEVCIGPARSLDSYLSVPAIITAAEITGADAIHPGYGFLSKSAYLAEACDACRLTFIGPPAEVIRLLGDKSRARQAMRTAGLPVVPGTESLEDLKAARRAARRLGFPVIIKATSGGGGRGMRVVRDADALDDAVQTARNEAEAAFGDSRVYLERYVEEARHIEFQVLADGDGTTVHLGERECTLQRRHQKVLEETPSLELTDRVRERMGKLVAKAARAVGYVNAGTFEFLMDARGRFNFMEANARLQVEHPITEMVTGVDVVKEQIRIASGESLSFRQADVRFTGHAIECRVNAEHPETFTPSPGVIRTFSAPGGPGVRIDTFAHAGCEVSPYYDSLVAKVIAHGQDRPEAIARMRRALAMTVIEGIDTNIPLHLRILQDPDFLEGRFTTTFLDRFVGPARPAD
jgi:acetyl-CoA carboxylase biotin carboxylase subunit